VSPQPPHETLRMVYGELSDREKRIASFAFILGSFELAINLSAPEEIEQFAAEFNDLAKGKVTQLRAVR